MPPMTIMPSPNYGYRPGRYGITLHAYFKDLRFVSYNSDNSLVEDILLSTLLSKSGLSIFNRLASQYPAILNHLESLMHLRAAAKNLGATNAEPLLLLVGPTTDEQVATITFELDREISHRALSMGRYFPTDIRHTWQDVFLAIGKAKDCVVDKVLYMPEYDAFISHASEDKETFVRPLAEELIRMGYRIWYDEFTLKVGDSLRQSIDTGLINSRYGIVIFSPAFISKNWPQYELNGLVSREIQGRKLILPVWHNIDHAELIRYSPTMADKVALNSNGKSVKDIAVKLADVIDLTSA